MKVNKKDLGKTLEITKPGLSGATIVIQADSFVFTDGRVFTYNDEISISCPLPLPQLQFDAGFIDGAIKADELYNYLKKVSVEEISVESSETEVVMKAGKAIAGFALNKEIQIPIGDQMKGLGKWKKLPENFNDAIKFAYPCAASDMANPKITCVNFDSSGKVEATDNYRVIRWDLNQKLPFKTTLIPADSVKEVLKIYPTHVTEGDGWVYFKNEENVVIGCRVFDEKFVNIDQILASKIEGELFTFPETTASVLERADVFNKSQNKNLKSEVIDVSYDAKFLKIQCQSETAWFKERITVKNFKGSNFNFRITPYLLRDILKQTNICIVSDNMLKFQSDNWVYISTLFVQ